MIEEYAVVVSRESNLAMLEIERRTACGLCGQKRGCGNATWGKLLGHKTQTVIAENVINAEVGNSVVVGINERVFLSSVFFLYVIPLLSMLSGAVLADIFLNNQFYVMLAALSGLVMGFWAVKRYLNGSGSDGSGKSSRYYAVILRHADGALACENNAGVNCHGTHGHDAAHAESPVENVVKFQTKRGE